jgi:hypothetical protein
LGPTVKPPGSAQAVAVTRRASEGHNLKT